MPAWMDRGIPYLKRDKEKEKYGTTPGNKTSAPKSLEHHIRIK